jgi:hypothetical protein
VASLKELQGLKEKDEQGFTMQARWRDNGLWLAGDGKTPVTFELYGSEAPTYLKRRSEMYREVATLGVEPDDATIAAWTAACAFKGWRGIEEPCTQENARAMMALEFLRAQVNRACQKGAGFFGDGSPD